MNSLMFDYILNVLTPKEYRLELKNRLENLCSLSGQTMSPGLTKWLEKTFGIEMVRVIQDYANLGGNKFPPDYLEKINRLVPGNYKGSNVNMGFRQLFDVSCTPPSCLWKTVYQDAYQYDCFLSPGWDFNGQGVDFPNVAAGFGGYFVQNGNLGSIYGANDTCNQVYFFYEGATAPADILVTDPSFGQIPIAFSPYCDYGCVTIPSFRYTDSYDVFGFFALPTTTTAYGGLIDFSDPVNAQQVMEAIIKSYFPTASVIVQDDGGGFFTITFQNVWFNLTSIPTNNVQFGYNGGTLFENLTATPC